MRHRKRGQDAVRPLTAQQAARMFAPRCVPAAAAGAVTWADVTGKPSTFPPESHAHGAPAWTDVTGKPTTFPPEAHGDHLTPGQAAAAAPVQSVAGRTGAVTLAKADVGLGSVDNTADSAKPVSTAQQAALDAKQSTSAKGQANGYASLGADGKVPSAQLPPSGGGATVKAGLVNLGAGASVVVTFGTPFALGVTPTVVVSSAFNGSDTSTTLFAHTITNVGFTLKGAGNAAGNVAWFATDAGNA